VSSAEVPCSVLLPKSAFDFCPFPWELTRRCFVDFLMGCGSEREVGGACGAVCGDHLSSSWDGGDGSPATLLRRTLGMNSDRAKPFGGARAPSRVAGL
jgi:hypothetical protein